MPGSEVLIGEEADFLSRVDALVDRGKPVVFLIGSGVSLPAGGKAGVPGTREIVRRIKALMPDDKSANECVDYGQAFQQLQLKEGQDRCNQLVREAVLEAYDGTPSDQEIMGKDSVARDRIEKELQKWTELPGHNAIATLIGHFPSTFGSTILTTNFDPLIEISLSRMGLSWYSSALHADGAPQYTRGDGTHIVHLHGDWSYSDTLHTRMQLTQPRPRLGGSIQRLLRESAIVVVGYGGWDDVFMKTLAATIEADNADIELIWGFHSSDRAEIEAKNRHVIDQLQSSMIRGRATFYSGISANETLPNLAIRVLNLKVAESLKVFFDRVRAARSRTSKYYPKGSIGNPYLDREDFHLRTPNLDSKPWNGDTSLGDFAKLSEHISPRLSARIALCTAQFLLPRLEGHHVHQTPKIKRFDWVRDAVEDCVALLDDKPAHQTYEELGATTYQMLDESQAILYDDNFASHALKVACNAVCAALAVLSDDGYFEIPYADVPSRFSSAIWAAKCVHGAARTLLDDDSSLLGYISERLLNGRDPYWRYTRH